MIDSLQNFVYTFEASHQVPRSSLICRINKIVDDQYMIHPLPFFIVKNTYPFYATRVSDLAAELNNSVNLPSQNEESFRSIINGSSDEEDNY